jgi:hypothetical protein
VETKEAKENEEEKQPEINNQTPLVKKFFIFSGPPIYPGTRYSPTRIRNQDQKGQRFQQYPVPVSSNRSPEPLSELLPLFDFSITQLFTIFRGDIIIATPPQIVRSRGISVKIFFERF